MKKQIESLPEETIPTVSINLTSAQITTLRVSLISHIGELQTTTEKIEDPEFRAYRVQRIDQLKQIAKLLWDARKQLEFEKAKTK
jgi:hypothetical protein